MRDFLGINSLCQASDVLALEAPGEVLQKIRSMAPVRATAISK
jgi:hypothetical protein